MGCTPAWWQLFKALFETGNEVIAIPYLGAPVESLWWRTYPNPTGWESTAYNSYLERRKRSGESPSKRNVLSPGFDFLVQHYIQPRWRKHLLNVLEIEKDIQAVLFMNVPMNHIKGIPSEIKKRFQIPVVYYDGDMPTSLPKYTVNRGFKFNYYVGADLGEYDALLANSEGCLGDLKDMGAKKVFPFHYGIDPQIAAPIEIGKDIDVSFFGYGSDFREEWMNKLISIPSKRMPDIKFAVAGGGFKIDLGNAKMYGDLSYSAWRQFCSRSRICLNITRWSHTRIFGSSTSRPFELAAYGACIVSQPYNGLEKWFDIGEELLVVNSEDEAIEAYKQLLNNDNRREEFGNKARKRVLNEHTFNHRAKELVEIIEKL
jgi:glycosyltransferase involved in cell wall biosynthesis